MSVRGLRTAATHTRGSGGRLSLPKLGGGAHCRGTSVTFEKGRFLSDAFAARCRKMSLGDDVVNMSSRCRGETPVTFLGCDLHVTSERAKGQARQSVTSAVDKASASYSFCARHCHHQYGNFLYQARVRNGYCSPLKVVQDQTLCYEV